MSQDVMGVEALVARVRELEAENARLRAGAAAVRELADRQAAFAGPEYTQNTDADRAMFRHAERMLRRAAELLASTEG